MPIEVVAFQSGTLLLIALYGTLTPKTSSALRSYFISQGFYVIGTFGAQLFMDRNNQTFATVYTCFTILMLWWVGIISMLNAICHPKTLLLISAGILISALPALMSIREKTPTELHGWIQLLEGSFLVGMGLITGMSAPFLYWANRKIALTLAVMWIVLGIFREGYRMHWGNRAWDLSDDWLPWAVTCIGMGATAHLMHRYSSLLPNHRGKHPQGACQQE